MRIAVTGATGFIGGAIAAQASASGHEVVAFGRGPRPSGIRSEYVAWDLALDAPAPRELAACDAVIHAAAHVAPWGGERSARTVTVEGTARLLEAIDPAARLVVIGSASVYDPHVPHILAKEPEAPVPVGLYLNAYGRAKADQERLTLAARPDAVVLRPRAVWGPGDPNLLPRVLARVHRGRLPLPDGGHHAASSTHVDSLVEAVMACVERPDVAGAINVADATAAPTAEVLGSVLAALDLRVRIVAVPAPAAMAAARVLEGIWGVACRQGEPPLTRYAVAALSRPFTLDLTRLHHDLGVRPDVDVATAARELALDRRATV